MSEEENASNKKLKRTADRQITKDDEESGDDEDGGSGGLSIGFKKADPTVLAKRRILKVKRNADGVPAPAAPTKPEEKDAKPDDKDKDKEKDKKEEKSSSGSSNPFANTFLVGKGSAGATTTSKVFGGSTGFSGFQTSTSTTTSKPFGFGSSTGTGTSAFSSGFGKPATSSGGTSNGTTTGASTGFGFGSSTNNGTSLFSASTTETSKFGFGAAATTGSSEGDAGASSPATAKENDTEAKSNKPNLFANAGGQVFGTGAGAGAGAGATPTFTFASSKKDTAAAATATDAPAAGVQLPDKVELTTGEEEETILCEKRCKTYIKTFEPIGEQDRSSSTTSSSPKTMATLQQSVPPSSSSIISSENKNDTAATTDASKETTTESSTTTTPTEDKGKSPQKDEDQQKTTQSQQDKAAQSRWQEKGIGPLRVLRSKTKTQQLRLVQRRESAPFGPATNVIVNLSLWKESRLQRPSEKHVQITTLVADGENDKPHSETYLFKFGSISEAQDLQNCLDKELESTQSILSATKTEEKDKSEEKK